MTSFPSLNETPLLSDNSLCVLYVDSLVCSSLTVGEGRYYWLVEVEDGRMHQVCDSLQGVQPLTQEVYRMLQMTGVLLRAAGCSKPTLRNPKLDQIAGKVETVQRRQQVRVASRSRTHKLRKQLVKSMSSLPVAPAKLSFVSEVLACFVGWRLDSALLLIGRSAHLNRASTMLRVTMS